MNSLEDALDELELDEDIVLVTAETADGYGSLLGEREGGGATLRAATLKVMAASCWCLVEPARARAAFSDATALYQDLDRSFCLVTAICAGQVELPDIEIRFPSAPDDLSWR
jgi:hypothetical protein